MAVTRYDFPLWLTVEGMTISPVTSAREPAGAVNVHEALSCKEYLNPLWTHSPNDTAEAGSQTKSMAKKSRTIFFMFFFELRPPLPKAARLKNKA